MDTGITADPETDNYGRVWVRTEPGLWRSDDGRYTIHRTVLPEPQMTVTYTLRHCDPATSRAWPGWIGVTIGTAGPRYSLADAQWEASVHARAHAAAAANDQALRDLPAVASEMFFWPVSEGITRASLTVTLERGRLIARVTAMSCQSGDPAPAGTWEPRSWAEVSITALWRQVLTARIRGALQHLIPRRRLAGQGFSLADATQMTAGAMPAIVTYELQEGDRRDRTR